MADNKDVKDEIKDEEVAAEEVANETEAAEEVKSEETKSEETKSEGTEKAPKSKKFSKKEKKDKKDEQIADLTDKLKRNMAEFDNYRKRMQTALGDARNDGFMDAIEKFLPALDSFKMATEYITDKNTLVGIKFIEKGILDTLSKMGVEEIPANGEFNPEFHQAVDTDSSAEVETNHIVKEVCKGFTYKGRVIRYSQVIVKK